MTPLKPPGRRAHSVPTVDVFQGAVLLQMCGSSSGANHLLALSMSMEMLARLVLSAGSATRSHRLPALEPSTAPYALVRTVSLSTPACCPSVAQRPFLTFISCCCCTAVQTTKLNHGQVIHINYSNLIQGLLPYMICCDPTTKSVVLAIRGSLSVEDCITGRLIYGIQMQSIPALTSDNIIGRCL